MTLPLPGTRINDAVIGSFTPRRCASVTGTRSVLGGGSGTTENSFASPETIFTLNSSLDLLALMLALNPVEIGVPPTTAPCELLVPSPPAKTRNSPTVEPVAVAEYFVSPMSIDQ